MKKGLLPFVDLVRRERTIASGHDRPKQTIISVSKKLAQFIFQASPFSSTVARVVRQKLRGELRRIRTGGPALRFKFVHVRERQAADRYGFRLRSGVLACAAAKDDDVQQTVAHQAVAAVDASDHLAGGKEVFHVGLAVRGDVQAAVLVVQRRIDKDRLPADVDAVLAEHPQHGGNALFNRALAVLQLNHGRVQPDGKALGGGNAVAAVSALTNDGCGGDIAGFQRVHKDLAVGVDQHCADGAHLFRDQRAVDLRGEGGAGGVVLERVGIQELRARAVAEHQTVGGRAVVVGGREALIVQTARTILVVRFMTGSAEIKPTSSPLLLKMIKFNDSLWIFALTIYLQKAFMFSA